MSQATNLPVHTYIHTYIWNNITIYIVYPLLFCRLKGIQRIFKLDAQNAIARSSSDQVQIYMIRSNLCSFNRVLNQVKLICKSQTSQWSEDNNLKFFHIICVPACFTYFAQLLEKEGLYGIVGLHRYNWDFIHLDEGVLSMEMPNVSC